MKLLARVAFSAALLGLAACADAPAPAPQGDIGFSGTPLKLDVTSVAVDNRYVPPGQAPNVEQLHQVTPSTIAERWLQTRVVPVGARGLAVLTVTNARVVEEKLPVKGGLTGFFGDQLDSKLIGTLKADLTVTRPDSTGAASVYKAGVTATGEQTILQSANLNDRDQAYFDLTQKLAKEFDRLMTAEVNRAMGPVLK